MLKNDVGSTSHINVEPMLMQRLFNVDATLNQINVDARFNQLNAQDIQGCQAITQMLNI
jgi:membrane-anchored protein YejM (alkaline phosphatase superfamily)